MSKWNIQNRLALVTGAAGLLGKQHVLALLEAGGTVIATDVSLECLERTFSAPDFDTFRGKIFLEKMDVVDEESVQFIIDKYAIEILINNAAVNPQVQSDGFLGNSSRLENFSLTEWDRQIAIGLTGAFICSKYFGKRLVAEGKAGVILNISSDLSVIAPDQRLYRKDGVDDKNQDVKPITYSVIKTGLIGLTRYLASYWADKRIRCNALSPGGIENKQSPEFIGRIEKLIPMGRMAKVDEYKSAVQFLCSDASSYMTGQNIVMDGGRSIV